MGVEAVRLPNGAQPVTNLVKCCVLACRVGGGAHCVTVHAGRAVCHCACGRPTQAGAAIIADACCWRRFFAWATMF